MADVVDYSRFKPRLRPFTVYEMIVVVPKIISQHRTYEEAAQACMALNIEFVEKGGQWADRPFRFSPTAEVINKPHVVEENGEWTRKVPVGWKDDKIFDA